MLKNWHLNFNPGKTIKIRNAWQSLAYSSWRRSVAP